MGENYFLINQPNIFDIMWLIKHSQMYIGSSLHGTITAMSFGVPYVGYGARKLKAYIEQWTDSNIKLFSQKNSLSETSINVYKSSFIDRNAERQKSNVIEKFHELAELYQ